MNFKKLAEIIKCYKDNFTAIDRAEIYKWRAVKDFQDNWDIESDNFAEMLERALASANNLMDSGQYFPKRMITQFARKNPIAVKQLFVNLYSEEWDKGIEDRWTDFRLGVEDLNREFFGPEIEKKSYQDHRAFMVYLALRFPENYFLFKFQMFKDFVEKVDFPYKPKPGRIENLIAYSNLCEILRNEIIKDQELLEMHNDRLGADHYIETSYHLLTQDIIYATVAHFRGFNKPTIDVFQRLTLINKPLVPRTSTLGENKSPSDSIDYEKRQKSNKELGNFGEQLIFAYEQQKLKKRGSVKEPKYVAIESDIHGYDILSYDDNDKEIYIEVKTTMQACDTPFFVTARELKKSIETEEQYRLYRVYDYDKENDTGKFREFKGSLQEFCTEPTIYKASVERN